MRVPLLDLSEQYRSLAKPIQQELEQVFQTQQFILGPKVEQFEHALCDYTKAKFAIGVSSGTDALLALLMALGIGAGDTVITSPYTFFATAGSITRVGATPIFVDIDSESFNLSPEAVEHFLEVHCDHTSAGTIYRDQHVRAILPVHLFGLCCEMDSIRTLAERFDLVVLEDAAQAIGAEYPSASGLRQAGTMGLAGCFSFYPSKNLGAAGDAGAIVTNDEELANRLRVCRNHGMEPQYLHQIIGGNFRLDEIQAALLLVKLPYLNQWSAGRRAAADFYRDSFSRAGLLDKVQLPRDPFQGRGLVNPHIFHQYIIRVPDRDRLHEHLRRNDIGSAIYYPLGLHEQKCFAGLGYKRGDLPETERAARETVAIPIYPEISREAQEFVVEVIGRFYSV